MLLIINIFDIKKGMVDQKLVRIMCTLYVS